ncbi:uncharacterized protein B0H64DRAFT_153216 [Chaetomium fimeti]|uniref:Uncharacterized protein n=1 Tax=Chaetomium fimeti TaxID=1854472 RepID=A0AAE0LT00_9PEZI|nr:hypothetical protein B0H64DRAFT_153216 [Chaetomium fimeti]
MEPQTTESPPPREPPNNIRSDDTILPPEQISFSVPVLRFPRPQGSQLLANWVSSSAPDIRQPLRQPLSMSDNGSLADSAYEIINGADNEIIHETDSEIINGTDNESQDDRMTESTCSLSASRPDDVHSLDGSSVDPYNTDSDDESDHPSRASSIRYADQALQNPSTQFTTSSLEHGSSTEGSGVVVRSIHFQESDVSDTVLEENISAKHAIRELSEEDSSAIAENLALQNPPRRWVVSIRQTMSQSYLSTKEPLRVLYVGPPEAQRAIVLKICSAIWESPQPNNQDYLSRHREGVYNIVPISSFGPSPELDLMEASQYQIKVEHCTSAEELVGPESSSLGEVGYSITIEQEKDYRSFVSPTGPAVIPEWDLPHIAVFYCSTYDDAESSGTRHAAWSFMERHGVPSIFIADQQDFGNSDWGKYINEHSAHLCLESRDPERPTAPHRFPIDYASFADIDARQMNRNLAYLTGLSETEDNLGLGNTKTKAGVPRPETMKSAKGRRLAAREEFWRRIRSILPAVLLLMGPFFALSMIDWLWPAGLYQTQPSSFTGVCVSSPVSPGFTTGRSSSVATSTKTVVINITSTKTVQATQTQPSTSTFASALSLAGFLSDKPSAVPADIEAKDKKPNNSNKTACSVRVHSLTEILVGVPSRNKAVWLAAGSIDITVRRNDHLIKTKISCVDEGVIVELDQKDAYGLVNITVVTTRRPRINETFQIDFGKSAIAELAETIEAGLHLLQGAIKNVAWTDDASQIFDNACRVSRELPGEVSSAFEHASEAVQNRADRFKQAVGDARKHLTHRIGSNDLIRKELDLSILQAQIASRLWWLRMQGKTEEYNQYKRNASRLLDAKHLELQAAKTKHTPNQSRSFYGFRSRLYSPWKKDSGRQNEDVQDSTPQDRSWETTWRKIMQGI